MEKRNNHRLSQALPPDIALKVLGVINLGEAIRRTSGKLPGLGFAARETAPGVYTFQEVMYVSSRNGEFMTKTLDPHDRLLTEQETKQLGYDTTRLIEQAQAQRTGSRRFDWRHHAIPWQDVW